MDELPLPITTIGMMESDSPGLKGICTRAFKFTPVRLLNVVLVASWSSTNASLERSVHCVRLALSSRALERFSDSVNV